jgi:uncharacterized membrane protein
MATTCMHLGFRMNLNVMKKVILAIYGSSLIAIGSAHAANKDENIEVTDLEYEVIKSLQQHEVITKNVENQLDQNWTLGERLADKIATFGGSWAFLMCFATFLAIWIIVNTVVMVTHPADPYPFILLNLILSCIAAIQAPVIMMSQNRQEAKDRLRYVMRILKHMVAYAQNLR